jgi:hypothetical protein
LVFITESIFSVKSELRPKRTVFITDAECVFCKVRALVEKTVDRRAWCIVNFENRRVKISTVNLPAYNISSVSYLNSVATVRINLTMSALSIF